MTARHRPRTARAVALMTIVTATATALAGCAPASDTGSAAPTTTPAGTAPSSSVAAPSSGATTAIRLTVDGRTVRGTLGDSPTARDLASRLPITLSFVYHDAEERTGRIAPPLTTEGAPSSADPRPNDIGYFAPANDVVLYNGDAPSYPGIIRIGRMSGDLSPITDQRGAVEVRIDRVG